MMLTAIFAVMTLLAAVMVVLPMVRNRQSHGSRRAHEVEIYRDQLDEVERDLERNLISAEEAEAARNEISRRLLAATDDSAKSEEPSPGRTFPVTAAISGICLPVFAAIVYLHGGSPGLPGKPASQIAAAEKDGGAADLRRQVTALADALEKEPTRIDNWVSMGDTLTALKQHQRAAVAYTQAMRLAPQNADYASRTGEALTLASDGQVTPGAIAAFSEALRRDPGDPRGQYYLGLADRQAGRLRAALDRWIALEAGSTPDAPWMKFLGPRIDSTAKQLGLEETALASLRQKAAENSQEAAPRRGPTREQVRAAQDMSAEDREAMIRSMVDRLAERLQETPNDVTGWRRLARARTVLGEKGAAKTALGKVAALQPDNVEAQVEYANAIVDAADPAPPHATELKPVVDRILDRDPENPRGLWLSGALAVSAGDTETARIRWTKLLDFVDPNSVQYVQLKKQIRSLGEN